MNQQAIINGGEEIEIFVFDGDTVKTETVKVRLLKIAEFESYLKKLETETALAEFLCDKPEGWGATLLPDSIMDILDKGQDLNFTTVRRYLQRRVNLTEDMAPAAKAALAARDIVLPTSAPTGQ